MNPRWPRATVAGLVIAVLVALAGCPEDPPAEPGPDATDATSDTSTTDTAAPSDGDVADSAEGADASDGDASEGDAPDGDDDVDGADAPRACETSDDCEDGNPCTQDLCGRFSRLCSSSRLGFLSQPPIPCGPPLPCIGEGLCEEGECVIYPVVPCVATGTCELPYCDPTTGECATVSDTTCVDPREGIYGGSCGLTDIHEGRGVCVGTAVVVVNRRADPQIRGTCFCGGPYDIEIAIAGSYQEDAASGTADITGGFVTPWAGGWLPGHLVPSIRGLFDEFSYQGATVDGGFNVDLGEADCADVDCDDGDPCTDDTCAAGACVHAPGSGAPCDDGDACTTLDVCIDGLCTSQTPVTCEHDGDGCATTSCLPLLGCVKTPITCAQDDNPCTRAGCSNAGCETLILEGTTCESGLCKTGGTCSAAGVCVGGSTKADGTVCDPGGCETITGKCAAGVCTGADRGDCQAGEVCDLDLCYTPGLCGDGYCEEGVESYASCPADQIQPNGELGDCFKACYGHRSLCDKPLTQITVMGSHNSNSSTAYGWFELYANNAKTLTQQLNDGVRSLSLDFDYCDDEAADPLKELSKGTLYPCASCYEAFDGLFSCDTVCPADNPNCPCCTTPFCCEEQYGGCLDVEREPAGARVCMTHGNNQAYAGSLSAVTGLEEIREWLEANPSEILIITVEEYLFNPTLLQAFDGAGLLAMTYRAPAACIAAGTGCKYYHHSWNNLARSGRRILMRIGTFGYGAFPVISNGDGVLSPGDDFTCKGAVAPGDKLFLLDNRRGVAELALRWVAACYNIYPYLRAASALCASKIGRNPNIIDTDWHSTAAGPQKLVNLLNGVPSVSVTYEDDSLCPECATSAGCPTGEFCLGGYCSGKFDNGVPCTEDVQCWSGKCHNLLCAECTTDSQCEASEWCETITGQCLAKFNHGVPCTTDVQCFSNDCDVLCQACSGDDDCESDEWCESAVLGQCFAKGGHLTPCTANNQCTSGVCKALTCNECTLDSHCATGRFCETVTGTCFVKFGDNAPCTADEQCVSGKCDNAHCVDCEADSDCTSGQYCDTLLVGDCYTKKGVGSLCLRSAECSSGLCPAGRCADCVSDSQCGAFFCDTLVTGRCQPKSAAGVPCTKNAQCISGSCSGVCAECDGHNDCPSGKFCLFGSSACVAKANDGAPCPDGDAGCKSGHCGDDVPVCFTPGAAGETEPCADDTHCSVGTCTAALCVPVCGDGHCGDLETCGSCSADCGCGAGQQCTGVGAASFCFTGCTLSNFPKCASIAGQNNCGWCDPPIVSGYPCAGTASGPSVSVCCITSFGADWIWNSGSCP